MSKNLNQQFGDILSTAVDNKASGNSNKGIVIMNIDYTFDEITVDTYFKGSQEMLEACIKSLKEQRYNHFINKRFNRIELINKECGK